MLDTTRDFKAKELAQSVGKSPPLPAAGIITVYNASGSDRDVLEILAIDVPLVLPTDNLNRWRSQVAMSCIAPGASHAGRYVVLQEPIAAGKYGRAMVIGVTPVNLDVTADTDRFAEIADGVTTSLKTGTSGSARILWKESGTGAKRGVVMLTGEPGIVNTYPPSLNDWHCDELTAVDIYEVTDTGGATQAILEIVGGGGGGGWGPTGTSYTGGGGGASGPVITTPAFRLDLGDLIEVVAIGAGGAGGTSGTLSGATGGATVASATHLGVVNTASGGYGGGPGGGTQVKGRGGLPYVTDTPYPQRSNAGHNSGQGDYGQGGPGVTLTNYGGGGNGGLSSNGSAGQPGVVRVWSNGSGLVLTPVP
jgi:hypothetical protein